MRSRILIAAVCWTLLIFILSSLSPSDLYLPDFWDLFSLDKLAHASFYGILFYLWAAVATSNGLYPVQEFKWLIVVCILYGGAIELYQGFILTDRTADWVDALANTIGVLTGYNLFKRKLFLRKN